MIEIFEPGSPEFNRQRAEQELGAARAASLIKARAAHLDLAARHFTASRDQVSIEGRPSLQDVGGVLQAAFEAGAEDEESARMLDLLNGH